MFEIGFLFSNGAYADEFARANNTAARHLPIDDFDDFTPRLFAAGCLGPIVGFIVYGILGSALALVSPLGAIGGLVAFALFVICCFSFTPIRIAQKG